MLTPPSLLPANDRDRDKTFDQAVASLQTLGIVGTDSDQIVLLDIASVVTPGDLHGFMDLLRRQALAPEQNEGIADADDLQGTKDQGAKDLTRALSWFLTLDAFTALDQDGVIQRQHGALPEHLGNPLVNDVRWNRFGYWAPALGFASPELLQQTTKRQSLVPDSTVAVRRTVRAMWPQGARLVARDAVNRIVDALPVLPGGRYSAALGLSEGSPDVSSTLSFALLCGDDEGWLKLDRQSDADDEVLLLDPDRTNGTHRVTHIEILESHDG